MRKTLLVLGLFVACLAGSLAISMKAVAAGAPTYNLGCVFHGWFVSGSTLTPFDAIIQESVRYSSATTGTVVSATEVVNTGGASICTYTLAATPASTFNVNSSGLTSATVNFAPAAGNPAGCATADFTATSQGVNLASGSYSLGTGLGSTGSGICSPQ